MASDVYEVSDPRVLRAVAHPVRAHLLYELHARGAARAADLAVDLHVPANSVSFHLRQLAKYGLIEPAPERARDRRDKWWKLSAERGLSWSSKQLAAQPGGEAAMAVWRSSSRANVHEYVDRFFARPEKLTGRTHIQNNVSMRLTRQELLELGDALFDLLSRWAERGRQPVQADESGEDARRTYLALAFVQPYDAPLG
jgi:predicted ArsR family transcriptional regulator